MKNTELTNFELSMLASASLFRSLDLEDEGDPELAKVYHDLYYKLREAEKASEEVELDEAKFKVGDEVMRTDKDNAPSGEIVKVLPGDKYLIKYTATKTVGDEKVSAKDLYLLRGKKKKAREAA